MNIEEAAISLSVGCLRRYCLLISWCIHHKSLEFMKYRIVVLILVASCLQVYLETSGMRLAELLRSQVFSNKGPE